MEITGDNNHQSEKHTMEAKWSPTTIFGIENVSQRQKGYDETYSSKQREFVSFSGQKSIRRGGNAIATFRYFKNAIFMYNISIHSVFTYSRGREW